MANSNDQPFDFDAEFGGRTAAQEWQVSDEEIAELERELDEPLGGKPYARERVFFRSSDSHGHGTNKQVKFIENQLALAQAYVDDRRTKYRNIGDLLRDALWHRLHDLGELFPRGDLNMEAHARVELMLSDIEFENWEEIRREELLKALGPRLGKDIDAGKWERVQWTIQQLAMASEEWPPDAKARAEKLVQMGREGLRRAVSGGADT